MENCTIYSHELKFDRIVEIVKKNLPRAKVEFRDDGIHKTLEATIKGRFLSKTKSLKINYRERENPTYTLTSIDCELCQNLAGMANYVQGIPVQDEQIQNLLIQKIMSLNCEIAFLAEPEITAEFAACLKEICTELDALVFAGKSQFFSASKAQQFLNKDLELILDTTGRSNVNELKVNINSKYFDQPKENYTEDQIDRKSRSEKVLVSAAVQINKNLPCIASEAETEIRSTKEVLIRAFALLVVSLKGEGTEQKHLDRLIKEKGIDGLSPKEKYIVFNDNLSDQGRAYAGWRYESLNLLMWALGKVDSLAPPSNICNVGELVEAILKPDRNAFQTSVQLRSKTEILDELDKTYRMNWACVNARIKGEKPSGDIDAGVVYERHYTLNWLTNYQSQDWDDIQTNT